MPRKKAETCPILPSLMDVASLMDFKLSEMHVLLLDMEDRLKHEKRCSTNDKLSFSRSDENAQLDTGIDAPQIPCPVLGVSHTSSSSRIEELQKRDILFSCISILTDSSRIINEAQSALQKSMDEVYEKSKISATPQESSVAELVCVQLDSGSSYHTLKEKAETDCAYTCNNSKVPAPIEILQSIEESKVLKALVQENKLKSLDQNTVFLQTKEENENLRVACTSALKIASNLEEIIRGCQICSSDKSENAENLQERIIIYERNLELLNSELSEVKEELQKCQQYLNAEQNDKLKLKNKLKTIRSEFTSLTMDFSLDLEKTATMMDMKISSIEGQLNKHKSTMHEKLQFSEMDIQVKDKIIAKQEVLILELQSKAENHSHMISGISSGLIGLGNTVVLALHESEELQSALKEVGLKVSNSTQTNIQLQNKLLECENQKYQAVYATAVKCKQLHLRNENLIAVFLLCISALSFCV